MAGNQPSGNQRPSFDKAQLSVLKQQLTNAGCSNVPWMLASTRWLNAVGEDAGEVVADLKQRYPQSFRKPQ